mgnify:CR=1 FL=1
MVPSCHQRIGHPTHSTNPMAQLQLVDDGLIEPANVMKQSSVIFMRMSTTRPNHPKQIPFPVHSASGSTNPVFADSFQHIKPSIQTEWHMHVNGLIKPSQCMPSSLCLLVSSINKSMHGGVHCTIIIQGVNKWTPSSYPELKLLLAPSNLPPLINGLPNH